jgi:hypothetical protein
MENRSFQNSKIDIKIQLAFLWASLMFCYIYCDYFKLYPPNEVKKLLECNTMLNTPGKLLSAAILLAVPALMICLNVLIEAKVSRILNIIFGLFYAAFLVLILFSLDLEWYKFYVIYAVIEVVLAMFIVMKAIKWPKS